MKTDRDDYARFQGDLRKAAALAKTQEYLKDILELGGKQTLAAVRNILEDARTEAEGTDDPIMSLASIENDFGDLDFRPMIESAVRHIKKREQFSTGYHGVIYNLEILKDCALLEQAIVAAMTSLEVYCSETASDILRANAAIRRRLCNSINASRLKRRLIETNWNLEEAMTDIDIYEYKFTDPESIRGFYRLILGDHEFLSDRRLKSLKYAANLRHIIVHNSCKADSKFIKKTGYRGQAGERVRLSSKAVGNWIHIIDGTGTQIEEALERHSIRLS
jgi:hypothetical protein